MHEYRARVVRVVDGDTLVLDVDLGFRIRHEVVVRLAGIDAPEMVGAARPAGEAAKDFVKTWLAAKPWAVDEVHVRTAKAPEKYGRWLAVVLPTLNVGGALVAGTESLNEALLAAGHAVPYAGGGR